ncbi:MAG: sigma-70 family RNA polymerase sigma factor [Planctomycetota bacterium]|nr:sigma-70 family RNA polymerase sigma factor [Planctomycetota bacterium]
MPDTSHSLLQRLQDRTRPDNESWARMVEVYSPLIRNWLKRSGLEGQDADDIVQEVLSVVFRRMPDFQCQEQTGSFRAWLRTIAINCLRDFWKARRRRKAGAGIGSGNDEIQQMLEQLSDPASPLSELWNREHDRHVTQYLMQLIQPEFSEKNWQAFHRVAVRGEPAKDIADELGMTLNAVYIARSRILTRLRQEGRGIVDSEFSA